MAVGTWSPSGGAGAHAQGRFPLLAQSANGCELTDTDGNTYVDWLMGFGPVVLGHRRPEVEAAITEQLQAGPLLSLLHPIEIEVAETLREIVPCCEGVAFGKNGSDVLALAVRVARAYTGRERIAFHGYHGFHDWYVASMANATGIPSALRETIDRFPYNDLDALGALFADSSRPIAAVVMEPMNLHWPAAGFLEGVRELCDRHGALLIFDEMLTGFRIARGGAEEAFGVRPDMSCVGKALANGMPLSALCGPARIGHSAQGVTYGLTYRGETLSLAAAKASLALHAQIDVPAHLTKIGAALKNGLEQAAERHDIAAEMLGFAGRQTLSLAPAGKLTPLQLQALFIQVCLQNGVLTNGSFLGSVAHGPEALATTLAAFELAFEQLALARSRGSLQGLLAMPLPEEFPK